MSKIQKYVALFNWSDKEKMYEQISLNICALKN